MKITLISNYFNHHQKSICDTWSELIEGQFTFVATQQISEMRKNLGYKEITADYVYSIPSALYLKPFPAVDESDVIIAGSVPGSMMNRVLTLDKLVFRYSERPLKNGFEPLKYPWRFYKWHKNTPSKANVYMLCASAYTASDYAAFGMYRKRTYKWGYFPETKYYEDPKGLIDQKDATQILWCGRFIDWKHPDDVLRVAARLKKDGYSFHINFIGTGVMEPLMWQMIMENDLEDCVSILGSMSPDQVRMHMEQAGIYLFTSDRKEGWGAVLNEAMNSGCAVVANRAAGSAPYLIKDTENGFLYRSGNVDKLYDRVKHLMDHPDEQKRMGLAAYETIVTEWNGRVAAERFHELAQHILDGEVYPDLYESGPCSRA